MHPLAVRALTISACDFRRPGPSTHLYATPHAAVAAMGGSKYSPPPSPTYAAEGGDGLSTPAGLAEFTYPHDPSVVRVPRRVKLLNFWARTRVVQRLIMVGGVSTAGSTLLLPMHVSVSK